MNKFSGKWWHHHIKKWKAVGDIFGVTGDLNDAEQKAKTIAENANKDEAGDQRYTGGYKSNTGESLGDAVGQSIGHDEGDDE